MKLAKNGSLLSLWTLALLLPLLGQSQVSAEPRSYEIEPRSSGPSTEAPMAPAAAAAPATAAQGDRTTTPPGIEPRRGGTSYFLGGIYDSSAPQSHLIKFQFDLEYDIVRLEQWKKIGTFYFTLPLTILSFWDVFDTMEGAKSQPFVETNYSPGAEIAWVSPWERHLMVRLGVMHQSNGLGLIVSGAHQLEQSRSWNRVYMETLVDAVSLNWMKLNLAVAGWIPFKSDEVAVWANGQRGGKIEDYVGYWELRSLLTFPMGKYPDLIVRAQIRQYSANLELRYSIKSDKISSKLGNFFRLDLVSQCHFGKAERLITANESKVACYVGFGL